MLALLTSLCGYAQQNTITVEDFSHDPNETTALVNKEVDNNNETCALIIVENVDVGGFKFSFRNAYSKAEEKKSDGRPIYYVYVSPGVKGISISNTDPAIAPLSYYSFPQKIQKGKTYHLKLGQVFKSSDTGKQYLQFYVTPKNATVEVEGRPWRVTDGIAEELCPFGTYNYRVSAPDYHTDAGSVVVNNTKEIQKVTVSLKPNFGWVDIIGGADSEGADIYIDGVIKGSGNMKQLKLPSGKHVLKVSKKFYKLFEMPFEVTDGQTNTLRPELVADFSTTTLTVPNGGEIWMDGKKIGDGEWRGPLEKGVYIVETRKASHKPAVQRINIESIDEPHSFTLPAPTPIYGELDITSTPRGASVMLNGRYVGVTPLHMGDVLIGNYKVEVSQSGYQPYTSTVEVKEKQAASVSATLSNISGMYIHPSPSYSNVLVDGMKVKYDKDKGYFFEGPVGSSHTLLVSSYDCKPKTKRFVITSTPGSIKVKLSKMLLPRRDFYWEVGLSGLGITGMDASMGFYINGFNAQFDYLLPFNNKETVYAIYNDNNGNDIPERPIKMDCVPNLWCLGGRIGYGFILGTRFRITPQVGCEYYPIDIEGYSSYATSCVGGLRIFLAFSHHFGMSLTPEYQYRIAEGDMYKAIRILSPTVDKWTNGLNLRLTFTNFF